MGEMPLAHMLTDGALAANLTHPELTNYCIALRSRLAAAEGREKRLRTLVERSYFAHATMPETARKYAEGTTEYVICKQCGVPAPTVAEVQHHPGCIIAAGLSQPTPDAPVASPAPDTRYEALEKAVRKTLEWNFFGGGSIPDSLVYALCAGLTKDKSDCDKVCGGCSWLSALEGERKGNA